VWQSCGDGEVPGESDAVGAGGCRFPLHLAPGLLGGSLVLPLLPPTRQDSLQVTITFHSTPMSIHTLHCFHTVQLTDLPTFDLFMVLEAHTCCYWIEFASIEAAAIEY
jgi:hypothetical protein